VRFPLFSGWLWSKGLGIILIKPIERGEELGMTVYDLGFMRLALGCGVLGVLVRHSVAYTTQH